jgi:hypothetical protein
MEPKDILNLQMPENNDAGARTIKEYLIQLLIALIEDGECFSGKRPLGNSSWMRQLYEPLVRAKLVAGQFDIDDNLDEVNYREAEKVLITAIEAL